ncbi:MAG: hypothetical protein Q8P95_02800, partial [bacterium]|nr:hypothetical protein [bacterium]
RFTQLPQGGLVSLQVIIRDGADEYRSEAVAVDMTVQVTAPPSVSVDAGQDIMGTVGEQAVLNGVVIGSAININWGLVSKPANSSVTEGPMPSDQSVAFFAPDVGGDYVFALQAEDGTSLFIDQVTLSVSGAPVYAISSEFFAINQGSILDNYITITTNNLVDPFQVNILSQPASGPDVQLGSLDPDPITPGKFLQNLTYAAPDPGGFFGIHYFTVQAVNSNNSAETSDPVLQTIEVYDANGNPNLPSPVSRLDNAVQVIAPSAYAVTETVMSGVSWDIRLPIVTPVGAVSFTAELPPAPEWNPSSGTVQKISDTVFRYTSNPGFVGKDQFQFLLFLDTGETPALLDPDQIAGLQATVTINVTSAFSFESADGKHEVRFYRLPGQEQSCLGMKNKTNDRFPVCFAMRDKSDISTVPASVLASIANLIIEEANGAVLLKGAPDSSTEHSFVIDMSNGSDIFGCEKSFADVGEVNSATCNDFTVTGAQIAAGGATRSVGDHSVAFVLNDDGSVTINGLRGSAAGSYTPSATASGSRGRSLRHLLSQGMLESGDELADVMTGGVSSVISELVSDLTSSSQVLQQALEDILETPPQQLFGWQSEPSPLHGSASTKPKEETDEVVEGIRSLSKNFGPLILNYYSPTQPVHKQDLAEILSAYFPDHREKLLSAVQNLNRPGDPIPDVVTQVAVTVKLLAHSGLSTRAMQMVVLADLYGSQFPDQWMFPYLSLVGLTRESAETLLTPKNMAVVTIELLHNLFEIR